MATIRNAFLILGIWLIIFATVFWPAMEVSLEARKSFDQVGEMLRAAPRTPQR